MPYYIREVKPNKYKVFSIHGTPLSKRPLSYKRASLQLAAVYAEMGRREKERRGGSRISKAIDLTSHTKENLKNFYNEVMESLKLDKKNRGGNLVGGVTGDELGSFLDGVGELAKEVPVVGDVSKKVLNIGADFSRWLGEHGNKPIQEETHTIGKESGPYYEARLANEERGLKLQRVREMENESRKAKEAAIGHAAHKAAAAARRKKLTGRMLADK